MAVKQVKYAQLLEEKRVIYTKDLGGRALLAVYDTKGHEGSAVLAVYTGKLTPYIAEVFPFCVSWPLDAMDPLSAKVEATRRAKEWVDSMSACLWNNSP
jgi:hypothetical protein